MGSSLLKDTSIYGLGSILRKGFAFFLIPIYTRFLSVEEYGMLALLNVMLQLISFVFLMGVSSASMRFYFNPEAEDHYRQKVYSNAITLLLILPLILFFFLGPLLFLTVESLLPSVPFFPYVILILLIGLFSPIEKLMLGLLRVRKNSRAFVFFTLSLFICQTILIIVAVVVFKYGIKGLLLAQLITNIIFFLIALKILIQFSKISFSWDVSKKLLVFGLPLIPFFIFAWINTASGRFLLERFASMRDVGIFALAAQFTNLIAIFGEAFDNAVLPYFYETAQKNQGGEIIGRFATKYFVLFGLLSLVTLVVSRPMVILMAAPSYHEAIRYIPLLILAGFIGLSYRIFHWSLLFSKKTGTISSITGISSLIMVGFLVLALKPLNMGIRGVVFVLIIVNFIKIFIGYFISQREFRIVFDKLNIVIILFVLLLSASIIDFVYLTNPFMRGLIISIFIFVIALFLLAKIAKIEIFKEIAMIRRKQNIFLNI